MSFTKEHLLAFSSALWSVHHRNRSTHKSLKGDMGSPKLDVASEVDLGPDEKFLRDLVCGHIRDSQESTDQFSDESDTEKFAPSQFRALGLTVRECDVMIGLALGLSDAEIGTRLSCATKTVGKHVEHILAKLGAETRLAAVWTAQERLRAQNR